MIVEDVLRIVNGGFRYPYPRRENPYAPIRIPDDYSISIAQQYGVYPYFTSF